MGLMTRWGTAVLGLAFAVLGANPSTAMGGRFYASARQCESAAALQPDGCRTAFANALAEFAAKAPSYRSRRACMRAFGPCMPWPMGTRRFTEFRPQWIGIELDADATARPAVAPGRLRLEFAPQSSALLAPAATAATERDGSAEAKVVLPADDGDAARGPAPQAGGGFTMIDGVLTYPAPARFQPRALKHP